MQLLQEMVIIGFVWMDFKVVWFEGCEDVLYDCDIFEYCGFVMFQGWDFGEWMQFVIGCGFFYCCLVGCLFQGVGDVYFFQQLVIVDRLCVWCMMQNELFVCGIDYVFFFCVFWGQ